MVCLLAASDQKATPLTNPFFYLYLTQRKHHVQIIPE